MNQVRRGSRAVLSSLATLMLCVVLSAPVLAQGGYPPPPPPDPEPQPTRCAQTGVRGRNGNFRPQSEFSPGERGVLRGGSRCARAEVRVRVAIDGKGRVIGSGSSNSRGQYKFGMRIPRSTSFGPHTLIVRTAGRQYETIIEVVPQGGAQDASFGSTAGPLLVAWVALVALVAAFFVASRRRKRPVAMVAMAAGDVPTIDTSGFVPALPQSRGKSTPKALSSKPQTARKKAGSKGARKQRAKGKAKPPSTQAEPLTPKPVAKKPSRNGAATTKRGGPKAPQRRAGNAKPRQPHKGTEDAPER